jgi:hypothetical protein
MGPTDLCNSEPAGVPLGLPGVRIDRTASGTPRKLHLLQQVRVPENRQVTVATGLKPRGPRPRVA